MTPLSWTVYLAAPIDQVQGKTGSFFTWLMETRRNLSAALSQRGAMVFDPYDPEFGSAIGQSIEERDRVRQVNDRGFEEADAVLAYLPDGVPTIGVPVEIERALDMGKPIVALGGTALLHTPMWPNLVKYDIDTLSEDFQEAIYRLALMSGFVRAARPINVPTARPKVGIPTIPGPAVPWLPNSEAHASEAAFFGLVSEELRRAEAKHPKKTLNNTTHEWFKVWVEEMVEVVQALNDQDEAHVIEELIQAGAMTQRFWRSMVERVDHG